MEFNPSKFVDSLYYLGTGMVSIFIVIGVIILQLVSLCLQWMAISANIVYIVKGGIIVLAVILDMLRWKIKRVEK